MAMPRVMSDTSMSSLDSSGGDAWGNWGRKRRGGKGKGKGKGKRQRKGHTSHTRGPTGKQLYGGGGEGGGGGGEGNLPHLGYSGLWSSEDSTGDGNAFGAGVVSSDGFSGFSGRSSLGSASIASSAGSSAGSMFEGVAARSEFLASVSDVRRYVHGVVNASWFKISIFVVILANTLIISLQTSRTIKFSTGWYFAAIDSVFLGIYTLELLLKLYVYRLKYFTSGWNWLDAIIVLLSYLEYVQFLVASFSTINPRIFRLLRIFRAFRALRALRVLRTISFLKHLQIIVSTLLSSIPALGSTVLILCLVLYIFAIIGRSLYGEIYPSRFGSLGRSFFSLFQLLTLDDWFEFYDTIKDRDPTILIYLITFILLETFIFINLFIAVLVNNLTEASKATSKFYRRKRRQRRGAIASAVPNPAPGTTPGGILPTEFDADADPLAPAAAAATAGAMAGGLAGLGHLSQTGDMNDSHASLVASGLDGSSVFGPTEGRSIDAYYPNSGVALREKQLHSQFFQLLASLEHNLDVHNSQQKSLDDLVDLAEEDDPE